MRAHHFIPSWFSLFLWSPPFLQYYRPSTTCLTIQFSSPTCRINLLASSCRHHVPASPRACSRPPWSGLDYDCAASRRLAVPRGLCPTLISVHFRLGVPHPDREKHLPLPDPVRLFLIDHHPPGGMTAALDRLGAKNLDQNSEVGGRQSSQSRAGQSELSLLTSEGDQRTA